MGVSEGSAPPLMIMKRVIIRGGDAGFLDGRSVGRLRRSAITHELGRGVSAALHCPDPGSPARGAFTGVVPIRGQFSAVDDPGSLPDGPALHGARWAYRVRPAVAGGVNACVATDSITRDSPSEGSAARRWDVVRRRHPTRSYYLLCGSTHHLS